MNTATHFLDVPLLPRLVGSFLDVIAWVNSAQETVAETMGKHADQLAQEDNIFGFSNDKLIGQIAGIVAERVTQTQVVHYYNITQNYPSFVAPGGAVQEGITEEPTSVERVYVADSFTRLATPAIPERATEFGQPTMPAATEGINTLVSALQPQARLTSSLADMHPVMNEPLSATVVAVQTALLEIPTALPVANDFALTAVAESKAPFGAANAATKSIAYSVALREMLNNTATDNLQRATTWSSLSGLMPTPIDTGVAIDGEPGQPITDQQYRPAHSDHTQQNNFGLPQQRAVHIHLNRPMIEQFVVHNSGANIDLDDLRRQVEELLLDIINHANEL